MGTFVADAASVGRLGRWQRPQRRRASGVGRMVVGEFQTTESVSIHFEQKETKGSKNSKGAG